MLPYIHIFGKSIPMYGICFYIGAGLACIWLKLTEKKNDFNQGNVELTLIYSGIGALIGSKLLFLATVFQEFKSQLGLLFTETELFLQVYFYSGFVFYGGFIGAMVCGVAYCIKNRLDIGEMTRCLLPVLPLIHGFGRIGCFCAGCCYGVESDHFGIAFTDSEVAPNGVPLLPVQLVEAAAEFILFFVLLYMKRKPGNGPKMAVVWLVSYGTVRFILEFFRGDSYRGFVGGLSIGQLISMALVAVGIGLAIFDTFRRRNRACI